MFRCRVLLHLLFYLCFLLALLCSVVNAQVLLGSKMYVLENNYWVSPNSYFAFGFFNRLDQTNGYNLGIRFNSDSIPFHEQTVVWIAGGDVSVSSDSYIHLTTAGDLVLFDSSKGVAVWSSNTSHLSVASACLLDNGNLVLLDRNQYIVWDSFRTPSDTLLPGQRLLVPQTLRAASRNHISSYYSLSINTTGYLKLSWETSVTFWESGPSSQTIIGAVFTENGALQVLDEKSRPILSSFALDHNDSSVMFRFLRLNVDGNLRMYSWSEDSRSWRSVWQAVKNQCNVFATCGLHGICVFNESAATICKCPFHPRNVPNSECLAPYRQECSSGFTMFALGHTFLYGLYPPNDFVNSSSLEDCRKSCLHDPLCYSVTVMSDGTGECRFKQTHFITGYEHPSITSISYVKVCLDPMAAFPAPPLPSSQPPENRQSRGFCLHCLIAAVSGTLFAFVLIQIGIGIYLKRKTFIEKRGISAFKELNSRGLTALSYSEIKDITKNFKNPLGPMMFKGIMPDDQPVVIRNLEDPQCGVDTDEKHFKCAVSVISSIHHKNLVKLQAYCCESEHRYLVYEYAKNGSVAKWLEDAKLSKRLMWRKRMEICVGVARAMTYLHTGCRTFVNHGNLSLQNVVLDEEMGTKLTEFGLGKVVRGVASSDVRAAEKDVAMFGEMVISLISGRVGAVDTSRWAYAEWSSGCAWRVVDARMDGGWDTEELERALRVAFWCVQADERFRPGMGEVVKVLEGTLAVDLPPSPFTQQRSSERQDLQLVLDYETD
ncbi:G-type lectin S-receptor-like serine/threonine-protein kinase SD3-1 [Aristolochia californica]|uniref:G-type lectin S-receptor-like serine/threonine-protein kinase SD3-1 n=1 Tax=Aristolochia californica TaxID=171875 RepID=UPI0035DE10A9